MAKVRLVVIGAGLIGREHCELIKQHDGTELVGLADISELSREYASSNGYPFFSDYNAMLDHLNPDGAIVALPNAAHLAAGLACLSRGLPCLIEKPIAETIKSAKALVEESAKLSVPVLVGHQRRYSPDIIQARRLIRDGAIGDLVAVNGLWMADKPDDYFEEPWRKEPGGGPLLINLIHEIDSLRYMVGEIESVRAFTSNAVRNFSVEDTASIALRFHNGVLGSFLLSDAVASPYTWERASGQALYFPHQPGDCYFIGGRKGSLAVPSMTLWRHAKINQHWQDPLVAAPILLDAGRAYCNQLEHFLDVISCAATPVVSAREGMVTLAATLAVDIAAREDRTVTVASLLA